MQKLGQAFDMNKLLQKINRIQAARSDGYPENTIGQPTTSYNCPTCRDEGGYLALDDEDREVYRFCSCREKRKVQKLFQSSRITWEFQQKTFDNFDLSDRPAIVRGAYQCARAYYDRFPEHRNSKNNSIALLGRPGCGKTHLLMAVANGLIRDGVPVMYFPWVEGFNEIKDNLDLTEERINKMQRVDVLFIDDMWKGRKQPTDFQIEQIFAVINDRYLNKRPVIISSEKDIDDMCMLDEAIGSRINEMCRDFRVVLKGDKTLNYRLKEDVG